MWEKIKATIAASRLLQLVLTLLLGMVIGALFYPTKHIEEKLKTKYEAEELTLKEEHTKEVQTVTTNFQQQVDSLSKQKLEVEQQAISLRSQVTELKKHQKKTYYKIVHPDGTIELKVESESDSDENSNVVDQVQTEFKQKLEEETTKLETTYNQQISKLQMDFDSKESDYKKQIQTLEQSKVVDINKRDYNMEVGVLTNRDFYLHASTTLLGPIIIGAHSEAGPSSSIGAGLGLKF